MGRKSVNNFDIYADVAKRTGGEIYLGVVGPVRTGKSTFVTQFMQQVVLPNVTDQNEKQRALDTLPQSADGKTVMTSQPKFVPDNGVEVKFDDQSKIKIRLIDCVGYMVEGALGCNEDDKPRLVKTPWSNEEIPFEQAAEIGTKKVVCEHSTVAIVVTNDGTITEIGRSSYIPAEERVIYELKALGKPFVVVLNSKNPNDEQTQKLRVALQEKYGVCVLAVDVKNMDSAVISNVMENLLAEFPLKSIKINLPKWMRTFEPTNPVIQQIIGEVLQKTNDVKKMKDCDVLQNLFEDSQDICPCKAVIKNMGQGVVECEVEPKPQLFFTMLSQQAGENICDEYSLMHYIKRLSYAKTQFDRVEKALEMVDQNGYGIVMPEQKDMALETPQIFKQGAQYGVKLKASAPTLHIMKVDVNTTVAPIVGSEQQCEYMLSSFQENPEQIWDTNMFGKRMSQLVQESLCNKSGAMPQEVQNKLRKTVGRVINENKGGLLCILL